MTSIAPWWPGPRESPFSPSRRRDGFGEAREIYLESYLKSAEELCGDANLGQVFLFGEKRRNLAGDRHRGAADGRHEFRSGRKKDGGSEYPSVSHLEAAFGGEVYLFLVNSANEAVRVEIERSARYGRRCRNGCIRSGESASADLAENGRAICRPSASTGWRFRQ